MGRLTYNFKIPMLKNGYTNWLYTRMAGKFQKTFNRRAGIGEIAKLVVTAIIIIAIFLIISLVGV